jgi:hypothetical protein
MTQPRSFGPKSAFAHKGAATDTTDAAATHRPHRPGQPRPRHRPPHQQRTGRQRLVITAADDLITCGRHFVARRPATIITSGCRGEARCANPKRSARRRLLALFVFGGPRLRQDFPGGYLCPGLPADRRPPTAEALLYGVLLLQNKIRRSGTIER